MRLLPLVSALALSSGTVLAQPAQHPEGQYGGVQPGHKPEKPKRPPVKGTLSWIGFEPKNGTSEVFFQSIAPFDLTQHLDKGVLVIDMNLTRLGQNTWRPIDTRFFDTPLARISAKKGRKGVEVRIAFKNAKDAKEGTLRTASEADGFYYAYLDWSGGGEAPAATDAEPEK
jgi:hypothetical protein